MQNFQVLGLFVPKEIIVMHTYNCVHIFKIN